MGVRKFPKLGLLQRWGSITLCEDLRLRWGPKKSCSPRWEISNDMWHATCTQGNQGNSWLLMGRNQIVNLTLGPSFGHNLCLKFPNGTCKIILDIYVPRAFWWYNELFNPMGFDPYNCFLKIWESIRTPTPKVGAHLKAFENLTLPGAWDVTLGLPSWPAPLQALSLVASPRLGLRHL